MDSAVAYVIQLLIDRFGTRIPSTVWAEVQGLLVELAMRNVKLTDKTRSQLQVKLLDILRRIGLEGRDL